MRRFINVSLALVSIAGIGTLSALTGCTGGRQSTSYGPQGKKVLSIKLTKAVLPITQEESKRFSVTVERENLNGPVQVNFDVPEGLKIKEPQSEWTITKGKKQKSFTVQAERNAKPQKEAQIRVTAKQEGMRPVTDTLKVEIVEGQDSKKARQDKSTKDMDDRLKELKKDLQEAGKAITQDIKDSSKKSKYLKRMAELYNDVEEVHKLHAALAKEPLETWEQNKTQVNNSISNVEQAVARFVTEIKEGK